MSTRIATVYTGATPALIGVVEGALKDALPETDIETLIYTDPGIIAQTIKSGKVEPNAALCLMRMYTAAASAGAKMILNVCSSIGDVATAAAPPFYLTGVPIVRIDEGMAREAVAQYRRIGVLATLPTTIEPTKRLIQKCADEANKQIVLVDALASNAYGLPVADQTRALIETAVSIKDDIDVLVMAQASMATCEEELAAALGRPTLSSPRLCGEYVRKALGLSV